MEMLEKSTLGGIPMIADDMMSFIKSDISSFWNLGVFIFIIFIATLWLIFRDFKWDGDCSN